MRYVIEAGTDVAMLCAFDPGALPADFEARMGDDAVATMEDLEREDRLWWKETGADGGYIVHFYVEERRPEEMARYCTHERVLDPFPIPHGTLWCCGAEYAARDPAAGLAGTTKRGLEQFPHMGAKVEVTPGDYVLSAWEVEWPEEHLEDHIRANLGSTAAARGRFLGPLAVAMFLLGAASCLILVLAKPDVWWAWGTAAAVAVLGHFLSRAVETSPAARMRGQLAKEYPAYVFELRALAPPSSP